MAPHVALDVTTWLSGYDLTGDSNATTTNIEVEPGIDTRFRMRGQSRIGGLHTVSTTVNGFGSYAEDEVDDTLNTGLAGLHVLSQSPDGAEGSVAWFWLARSFTYQTFGGVGEVSPFTLTAQSARGNGARGVGAVRGRVLLTNEDPVSATGPAGTAYELGAVPSGKYLYAALHTFEAGTTVTAVLESAPDNTFAAATTRATFGPTTATGAQWATRVAGPIVDTWYRVRVTAITGSFSLALVAGVK